MKLIFGIILGILLAFSLLTVLGFFDRQIKALQGSQYKTVYIDAPKGYEITSGYEDESWPRYSTHSYWGPEISILLDTALFDVDTIMIWKDSPIYLRKTK